MKQKKEPEQTREQKLTALLQHKCGFEESLVRMTVSAVAGNGAALGMMTNMAEMIIELRQLEGTAKFDAKQARSLLEQKTRDYDLIAAKLEGVKLVLSHQSDDSGRRMPHPAFFFDGRRPW